MRKFLSTASALVALAAVPTAASAQYYAADVAPPVVYVDVSAIREGKHEELEAAMKNLSHYVEEHMPRLAFYGFFLDEARTTMTVVAVHPDSASLAFHMDEGNQEFRKFGNLIDLARIDVYGDVSDQVKERLHRKARMLGRGTVTLHELHAGFVR